MSPIPQAASLDDRSEGCDKVIIQTFEGDHDTMNLRLTATVVTSMAELRARASAFKD
jgi:primosomal protein N'